MERCGQRPLHEMGKVWVFLRDCGALWATPPTRNARSLGVPKAPPLGELSRSD